MKISKDINLISCEENDLLKIVLSWEFLEIKELNLGVRKVIYIEVLLKIYAEARRQYCVSK